MVSPGGHTSRSFSSQLPRMPLLYALSCLLLSVASIQFHKVPAQYMPPWVNVLGGLCSLASMGMLIAGFFVTTWWVPIVLFVLGPLAYAMIPAEVRKTRWDLILFGGMVGGLITSVMFFAD